MCRNNPFWASPVKSTKTVSPSISKCGNRLQLIGWHQICDRIALGYVNYWTGINSAKISSPLCGGDHRKFGLYTLRHWCDYDSVKKLQKNLFFNISTNGEFRSLVNFIPRNMTPCDRLFQLLTLCGPSSKIGNEILIKVDISQNSVKKKIKNKHYAEIARKNRHACKL